MNNVQMVNFSPENYYVGSSSYGGIWAWGRIDCLPLALESSIQGKKFVRGDSNGSSGVVRVLFGV